MIVKGRRVIVTGAASGIGQATVARLVAEGARVAAFDIVPPTEDTHASEALRHWQVDVRDDAGVSQGVLEAAEWLGGSQVDVLVSVAGIMRAQRTPIDEVALQEWEDVIEVNLRGTFLMVKNVVPRFPPGTGAIVLVSSVAGVFVGSGSFPYGASKGGVHGLALTLEEHLGPSGVRVNEVCPRSVHTPLLSQSLDEVSARLGTTEFQDEVVSRWVEPEQIAALLVFLASEEAGAVRGTIRTA